MIGEKGLDWELQWHRTGGESVRVVLSQPMVRGLASAFVAAAAVALGCGLAGGLDRIGLRGGLVAAGAENRALIVRSAALRERLQELGDPFEVDGDRGHAGRDDGASAFPSARPPGGRPTPERE